MALIHLIFQTLLQFIEAVFAGINWIFSLFMKTDHRHKSSFGDGEFLSGYNTGFNVTGKASLSIEVSQRNIGVFGETGSSKTSGMLIKSCLFVNGSQLIHAPNFEIFEKTSGFRSLSDTIKIFCPTHPDISSGFNPLLRCNTLAEINRLSHLLISLFSSKQEKGSFWNNRAMEILTILIARLKKDDIPIQYQTLPNVCHLLDFLSSEKSRAYIHALFMDLTQEDDWLYQKYQSITSQSDSVLQGVISSAQSALSMFELDDDIRLLVSNDDFGDFDTIRQKQTSLYLVSSTTKGAYYGSLISIFMDQFFESFFKRIPSENELDVFFHIDESPLIHLDWDILCANIRKHKGAICLLAQNPYNQFSAIYGEHKTKTILSNLKTKAYFSMDHETAQRVERELGIFTYKDEFDEKKMKTRSLLTASELMQIKEDQLLITHSGHKPVLLDFVPYYMDRTCITAIENPPYTLDHKTHNPVQLLPLKQMYPNAEDHEV